MFIFALLDIYARLEKGNEWEAAREMNHCSDFSEAFDK